MYETDGSTVTLLQEGLMVSLSDAVTTELLGLTVPDLLPQAKEVLRHGDLLDVGQHKTALSSQSYWQRI